MPQGTRFLITFRGCRGPISVAKGFKTYPLLVLGNDAGIVINQDSHYTNRDGSVNFRLDLGRSHFSGTTYLTGRYLVADLTVSLTSEQDANRYRHFLDLVRRHFKPLTHELQEVPWK